MILTAQEVIDQAFSLIGVLGTGSILEPAEYKLALRTMNLMIDRWNLTDLLVYTTNPHDFAFVPGQSVYTLGAGGDFDMPRPSRIDRVSIVVPTVGAPDIEIAIDPDFDLEGWQGIVVKATPSQFPLYMYNNTGFPYMDLHFWPVPAGPASVRLYTWDMMPFVSHLTDNLELPTGYTDAVIYNLAVRLAQLFDRVPTPTLVMEAKQALHDINDINNGSPTMHVESMWSGSNHTNSIAARSWGKVVM